MTARTSHLAEFLIDIFNRNGHYEPNFGTIETLGPIVFKPTTNQCCQLFKKITTTQELKQYSYFPDMPRIIAIQNLIAPTVNCKRNQIYLP